MNWSTYGDELDRVMMGNTVRHPCHGGVGGEWDTLRFLLGKRPRVSRRLVGARLLTPYGMAPDVATHDCIGPNAHIEDVDEAMAWYLRMCLLYLNDRQKLANYNRHQKLARNNGFYTYFGYRDSLSKQSGYASYHFERKERWPKRSNNG